MLDLSGVGVKGGDEFSVDDQLTMSKAFEKSVDMVTVQWRDWGWLKPQVIWWVMGRRAVVVDLFGWKLC